MATAQASKRKGDDVAIKSSKKVKTENVPAKTRVTRSKPTTIEVSKTETVPTITTKTKSKAPAVQPTQTDSATKSKPATNGSAASKSAAATKKGTSKKAAEEVLEVPEPKEEEMTFNAESEDESDEEDTADQAAALLAGFESDSDSDAEDGIPAEKIPSVALKGKDKSELTAAKKKGATDQPGTVYIGRVPHGFYEHQMKEYFSQFGNITKLRLSRNKKTGRSKHYAFIEFDSSYVADIVARTMNKYLLFGHILQVRVMPQETIPEKLWIGANKRYKVVPRTMMEGRNLKTPKTVEQWEKRESRETKRRSALKKKMEAIGYDFDMPDLKPASAVQMQKAVESAEPKEPKAIEPVAELAIEPPVEPATEPVVEQQAKAKGKKKRAEDAAPAPIAPEEENAPAENTAEPTKAKKASKRAASVGPASDKASKKTKTKDAPKKKTRNSSAI